MMKKVSQLSQSDPEPCVVILVPSPQVDVASYICHNNVFHTCSPSYHWNHEICIYKLLFCLLTECVTIALVRSIEAVRATVALPRVWYTEPRRMTTELVSATCDVAILFVATVRAVLVAVALLWSDDATPVSASEFALRTITQLAVEFIGSVSTIVVVVAPPSARNASTVVALEIRFVASCVLCRTNDEQRNSHGHFKISRLGISNNSESSSSSFILKTSEYQNGSLVLQGNTKRGRVGKERDGEKDNQQSSWWEIYDLEKIEVWKMLEI